MSLEGVSMDKCKVGEIRPSQMLFTYGIGSVIDLPNISAMVMGLDDWDPAHMQEIGEERLLAAVRDQVGAQVERLVSPPMPSDGPSFGSGPFDSSAFIGVPVAAFPRWMRCPSCNLLAPLSTELFTLKANPYRPERTKYVHSNCIKPGAAPAVVPVRFLVACERGHLDDFPWIEFVHRGQPCASPILRLHEWGVSGSASDIEVRCDNCKAARRMSEAFGQEGREAMPNCRGRRPHLRDFETEPCTEKMGAILLGASNSWFAVNLSSLSIPSSSSKLRQLVDSHWHILVKATMKEILVAFRQVGNLNAFVEYSDDEIWAAIQKKGKSQEQGERSEDATDLKTPEWKIFSNPLPEHNTADFQLTPVEPPAEYQLLIKRVLLVERLREVKALIGFTRIESPWDYGTVDDIPDNRRMPLSRTDARYIPASEVRGEGIFIEFSEPAIGHWQNNTRVAKLEREFLAAHSRWREVRGISPPGNDFPGIRFVLIHSFAHALMRQLALECGYTAASIRERIYSQDAGAKGGPMAGVLLYTAAPDSEGTLGGLVSLGVPGELGRHIANALDQMRLCASDPLCAEHRPPNTGVVLHGASCHACLFAPETSCERGNKYLDRSVLVETFCGNRCGFFDLK